MKDTSPALGPCDPHKVIQSHQVLDGRLAAYPVGLDLIKALFPRGRSLVACISSRIATVIQVRIVRSNEP